MPAVLRLSRAFFPFSVCMCFLCIHLFTIACFISELFCSFVVLLHYYFIVVFVYVQIAC